MSQLVDYDALASDYGARYRRNDYSGVEQALAAFVAGAATGTQERVLEVGCGTGHWVHFLRGRNADVIGMDPSEGMLNVARRHARGGLIRARAEALPCRAASCRRIVCVNALHHFTDPAAFFREARRVLSLGGGLLTIGLDPHTGQDRWWIYDHFPSALIEDRKRYLATNRIRELMQASGFAHCDTREVQRLPTQLAVSEAARRGFLERTSTSQLMVISQAEYDTGMKQIRTGDPDAVLTADLRLYGTTGWAA